MTRNILYSPQGDCRNRRPPRRFPPTPSAHGSATGRANDIEAGKSQTAYGRFSQRYDSIMAEHCSPDANRSRELDRAFDILERTCECGSSHLRRHAGKSASELRPDASPT